MKPNEMETPLSQLIAEYQAGATVRELARRHGGSFQNIAYRLKIAGVKMRPSRESRPLRICPTCNRQFRPYHKRQVFCRASCIRQKDTCIRGHPLTEENRYHFPGSNARCRLCQAERSKAYAAKKKL